MWLLWNACCFLPLFCHKAVVDWGLLYTQKEYVFGGLLISPLWKLVCVPMCYSHFPEVRHFPGVPLLASQFGRTQCTHWLPGGPRCHSLFPHSREACPSNQTLLASYSHKMRMLATGNSWNFELEGTYYPYSQLPMTSATEHHKALGTDKSWAVHICGVCKKWEHHCSTWSMEMKGLSGRRHWFLRPQTWLPMSMIYLTGEASKENKRCFVTFQIMPLFGSWFLRSDGSMKFMAHRNQRSRQGHPELPDPGSSYAPCMAKHSQT